MTSFSYLVDDYVGALDDASRQLIPRCASAVKKSVKEVRKATGCTELEAVSALVANLFAANVQLTNRIKALETRPVIKYRGVWDEGTLYPENELVTHQGSLWISKFQSRGRAPGIRSEVDETAAWQLCAKRGRDGKDAR